MKVKPQHTVTTSVKEYEINAFEYVKATTRYYHYTYHGQ